MHMYINTCWNRPNPASFGAVVPKAQSEGKEVDFLGSALLRLGASGSGLIWLRVRVWHWGLGVPGSPLGPLRSRVQFAASWVRWGANFGMGASGWGALDISPRT